MTNCRLRKTFITFCNCTKFNVTFVHMKANTLLLLLCNHNYKQDDGVKKIRPRDKSSYQRRRERDPAQSRWSSELEPEKHSQQAGCWITQTEDTEESVAGFPHCSIYADKQDKHFNRWHTYIQHMDLSMSSMKCSKYLVIYVILNSCYSGQTTQLEPKRRWQRVVYLNFNQKCWGHFRICSLARKWNSLLYRYGSTSQREGREESFSIS